MVGVNYVTLIIFQKHVVFQYLHFLNLFFFYSIFYFFFFTYSYRQVGSSSSGSTHYRGAIARRRLNLFAARAYRGRGRGRSTTTGLVLLKRYFGMQMNGGGAALDEVCVLYSHDRSGRIKNKN